MKNIKNSRLLAVLLLSLWFLSKNFAQSQTPDPNCSPSGTIRPAAAFFNYGNGSKMKNSTRRMKLTIGQPVVGSSVGDEEGSNFGYWSGLLVAPLPPVVTATQGELLDRIQISWANNPLGAFPNGGFKLYRDGVFLALLDKNTKNYNDFNVIAGRNYKYEVRGINLYGEGSAGNALGFQVPNGVVTGWVRTLNGSAVPNAQVSLSPMQGYSTKFGQFDGAFAKADTGTGSHFLPTVATGNWSLTFWTKTQTVSGTASIFQILPSLDVQATATGVFVKAGGANFSGNFSNGNANSWHHVALTFGGGQYRLFLDGTLANLQPGTHASTSPELNFGEKTNTTGSWSGFLDEFRIYHSRLEELDLPETMGGTASSLTPNLKYYWKMDEGAGTKSFDILRRNRMFFCGPVFSADRPAVATSGVTNSDGYYRIESASYGTGTTFLATPKKDFYKHRALKFLKNEADYALLPDFALTPKSTIEMWVNQTETAGDQTLLNKKWGNNAFILKTTGGNIELEINGTASGFGALGIGYRHLAVTIEPVGAQFRIVVFKDGTPSSARFYPLGSGNWSDPTKNWVVGALNPSGTTFSNHFSGLIDEVAFYDTTLAAAKILSHVQNSRDPQERGLRLYFPFDEGTGNKLNNLGSVFLGASGTAFGTEWTILAPNQSTTPHVFAPATRQVTLNPSVTSVDQVDFTDRSTVAVSGFVRFKDTDCFAKDVEILVNGEPFVPTVLTDSTGKFVVDLEPGASVSLTPKYKDHAFLPAFLEVINLISPIGGLLFNDVTVREISGQVAGGTCKKSIISNLGLPSATICKVKVRTTDGCFEKILTVDNTAGNYEFQNLPPLEMTVAVSEHSDFDIFKSFEIAGGQQVDLREKADTVLNFIYFAPPEVEIASGLDPFSGTCATIVLAQHEPRIVGIKVKETYYNNQVCYLDTANLQIINGFADTVLNTALSNGLKNYKFRVGSPVGSPPFLKTFQVIATTLSGNETSKVVQGVVTGIRNKHNTFTTQLPETPSLILRDPPGDQSYSFLEKNQTICHSTQVVFEYEVGGALGFELNLSADSYVLTAPLGLGFLYFLNTEANIIAETQLTYEKTSDSTFQTCTTISERIQTNDGELVVGGQGGDVFVGNGLNLEFGFADKVVFNDTICAAAVQTVLNVEPDTFSTQFVYSEWGIRNTVIRYLDSLIVNPATAASDLARYTQSKKQWLKILADNQRAKDSTATILRNISFDAGPSYEYSISSDTATTDIDGDFFNTESFASVELGFGANGFGFSGTVKVLFESHKGKTVTDETQKGVKTGYVLKDDDVGDAFSVDVAMDPVYKTPIFKTKSGQSSCPWEPETAHREGTSIQFRDGSGPDAIDIPSKEAAVFKFTLGNNSETNESFTYAFNAGSEQNPHGAKIFLNGAPLDHPVFFSIPYGTSIPITVTVERGPEEYDYDSLKMSIYSLCERTRANTLGVRPDDDEILYSSQYISAHFIRPCSEVEINVPEQDWVAFPGSNTIDSSGTMRITASGYDKSNADFEKIRVQYRRTDGDGDWINIVAPDVPAILADQIDGIILKNKLGEKFTQFYWNTAGLQDGGYEIRAIAVCTGDAEDKPGISHTIRGRIERQPPSLIGTPEPSDGVFQQGDEVSFSFNKNINCSKINAVDNVLLFNTRTDDPIDIDITCKDNQIFLVPTIQNQFFENDILRAELHDIEDKTGNILDYEEWQFYVDRNELAWLTDSLGLTKYEDQSKTASANIQNRGGSPVPFLIENAPSWVRVVPNQGTLAPNEVREIRFEIDSSLAIGHWFDTIVLHTVTGQNPFFMGGDEGLPFGVRVVCRPPSWNLNAGVFENSMNMILKLNIEGQNSTDVEDMVVAYIADTLVGRAHIQYVPQVDSYLAYLTIYGNPNHTNQPLRLEIWDASACLRYTVSETSFVLQPDFVLGNPTTPQVIHTNSFVVREVPLGFGWNWLSFNLAFQNPAINPALASLKHPQNDFMKSQSQLSEYTASMGWVGDLLTLTNTKKYVFRANLPDTLKMVGTVLNPAATPIPVVSGWNWIGYIPNYALPLNLALSSLNPQPGDLIKSQSSFAQFISPSLGWIGNLQFMAPPQGYQLKISTAGSLVYPPQPQNRGAKSDRMTSSHPITTTAAVDRNSFWDVDPTKFEHSTTLIGMLKNGDANATTSTMELGVFAGGEVRGTASAIHLPMSDTYVFFLTTFANVSGEKLQFKLFDSTDGTIQDLAETMFFSPDQHQGSVAQPVPFSLKSTASGEQFLTQSFDIQPNPMRTETVFKFGLPHAQDVVLTIADVSGKIISEQKIAAAAGLNQSIWRVADLDAGVYFVRLETDAGSAVRKLVVQK